MSTALKLRSVGINPIRVNISFAFYIIVSRILNNRLDSWAENYSIYVEAQAGFRKGMGTTDNVFVLNGLINHFLNNKEYLYCAFIDFQKTLNFVVRDILWYKLKQYGVGGNIFNVIKSMYYNVKS